MNINLKGPFFVTQECAPDMIAAKWGRIINITSSSVQSGSALQTHYTSSKGALLGFTKCLAMALGEHGITANMIPPGSIDTPMLRGAEIMQKEGAVEGLWRGAAGQAHRQGRGHRRRCRFPRIGRSGLHDRPDDQRERRPLHGLCLRVGRFWSTGFSPEESPELVSGSIVPLAEQAG